MEFHVLTPKKKQNFKSGTLAGGGTILDFGFFKIFCTGKTKFTFLGGFQASGSYSLQTLDNSTQESAVTKIFP